VERHYKWKSKQWLFINNYTNINNLKQLNTKKTTYDIGNPGPGLQQTHVDCSFSNIEIQLILLILYKTVTNWIDNLMTFKLIDVVMVSVLA
jgi:hypothetical protein